MKRLAWVGIGVLIGVVGSAAGVALGAPRTQAIAGKLVFLDTETNSPFSSLVFINDPLSGGCWLGVDARGQGVTTLAVAPPDACRKR
jgi:hypothetical protein